MNPEEGSCVIARCRAKDNKQHCQNITIYTQIFLSKFSSSASLLQPQVNTHSKVLPLINSHMLTKLSLIVCNITAQMEQKNLPVLFFCSHEINLCISVQRHPTFHMHVELLLFVISLFIYCYCYCFRLGMKTQCGSYHSTYKKFMLFLSEGTPTDHFCSDLSMRAVSPELVQINQCYPLFILFLKRDIHEAKLFVTKLTEM